VAVAWHLPDFMGIGVEFFDPRISSQVVGPTSEPLPSSPVECSLRGVSRISAALISIRIGIWDA